MAKKRPWIKVEDETGFCQMRCKDPDLVAWLFVHGTCLFTGEPVVEELKLYLDGKEYNPPVVIHDGITEEEAVAKALEELNHLIDTHQAFYG